MTILFWSERPPDTSRRPFGRALLAAGLSHLGVTTGRVVIGPGGKPRLEGASHHFNISHTAGLSVCAISRAPVGVDVESTARAVPAELPERFFTPRELAELAADPSRFLPMFTRKEAWTKWSGFGIGVGLGHFDIPSVMAADPDLRFATFDLPTAVCSVCTATPTVPIARHIPPTVLVPRLQEAA